MGMLRHEMQSLSHSLRIAQISAQSDRAAVFALSVAGVSHALLRHVLPVIAAPLAKDLRTWRFFLYLSRVWFHIVL